MFWTHENVSRIVLDFSKKVKGDSYNIDQFNQTKNVDLLIDFQLSSIQLVELTAYLNSFFHLLDVDTPPQLLADAKLNNWVEKILKVRLEKDDFITFHSSGTSGQVKFITHSVAVVMNEINFLITLLPRPEKLISFVPTNHIYGFFFTVVLPAVWDIPVISGAVINKHVLTTNSMIIATPFNWDYLRTSLNNQLVSCMGISAAAPLNDRLYQTLIEQGFQITEIYGSTETSGVGYRQSSNELFQLFPYLDVNATENVITSNSLGLKYPLLDHLNFQGERFFSVQGRIDNAVQIGGVNIYLDQIQQTIQSISIVKRCELFAKSVSSGLELDCSIYLTDNSKKLQAACLQQMHTMLTGVNYPSRINFYSADNN